MALYREADDLTDGALPIPYGGLRDSLYSAKQMLIPLLGAGASLRSAAGIAGASPSQPTPDASTIDAVCTTLGVNDPAARVVIELAAFVATKMQSETDTSRTMYERVVDSPSPPSAADLAEAFAEKSSFNHFEWALSRIRELDPAGRWDQARLRAVLRVMSEVLGLGSPSPSLLEVASYYEYTFKRDGLREFLGGIFNARKSEPTSTHGHVAAAAHTYIAANGNDDQAADYLIITTNYDGLIEIALERAQLPYAVLTVPRDDWKVNVQFHGVQAYLHYSVEQYARFCERVKPAPPGTFSELGRRSKPIVVLYKIHGSLYPPSRDPHPDSIVISDDDYVRYFQQDARIGMVPAYVTSLMEKKALLVLGYRFADWNVRSLYSSIADKREPGRQQDWVVSKSIARQERVFFESRNIHMAVTSLDRFWAGIGGPPGPTP